MKRFTVIFFSLFITFSVVIAQDGKGPMRKRLDAVHAAWLTRELNITPEEAQKFWPVYNNYQRELQDIEKERRQDRTSAGGPGDADEIEADQRVLELRKKYVLEFRKSLPGGGRANRIFRADREFRNQLIQQLRKRKQG